VAVGESVNNDEMQADLRHDFHMKEEP
jgi:hypothetical protein